MRFLQYLAIPGYFTRRKWLYELAILGVAVHPFALGVALQPAKKEEKKLSNNGKTYVSGWHLGRGTVVKRFLFGGCRRPGPSEDEAALSPQRPWSTKPALQSIPCKDEDERCKYSTYAMLLPAP